MAVKNEFSSKIGLVAATVGSAVGLGNIWRFPAEAQAGGGAAFLLVYILCVCVLGIPVMLAEFSIGRAGGTDAIGAFRKLSPGKAWWMVGALAILTSYLILSFYMVVAGWTFEYMWQSITGGLYAPVGDTAGLSDIAAYDIQFAEKMHTFIQGDTDPLINTYIMIGLNLTVLIGGVSKGIERLSNVLMPLLFLLLVVFCCVSLSLPEAGAGLEFFLRPDFSKITPTVWLNALGQAFFSLSLGMGILITYSAYYPRDTRLTGTAMTVSLLDMLVAVMMGIIIFPAVTTFGLGGPLARRPHISVRHPARSILADARYPTVVGAVLPAAHGSGAHFDHIYRRGVDQVHSGPVPHLPRQVMPDRTPAPARAQRRVLAVARPAQPYHCRRSQHIRHARQRDLQLHAPCRIYRHLHLSRMVRPGGALP